MQQNFFATIKNLFAVFGVIVLLFQVYQTSVSAWETQREKVDAISELAAEINYFYLHPTAETFMNNFYTRTSYENLREAFGQAQERKIPNWETELDDTALTDLYQLLRSAVEGLRPLTVRRGEATSQGLNLNFRPLPEVNNLPLDTLPFGTSFEILEEVRGEVVIGADQVSRDDRWVRIRHDGQSGYVHARYVRNVSIPERRIRLLADIGRQELWIQSKIDGWRVNYSPNTRNELREILNAARALQTGNWQFNSSYSELEHILQSLSYEHLNLVTLFRYHLINNIVELKREVENNIQGTGNLRMENYTFTSRGRLHASFIQARSFLNDGWQETLSDEDLEFIHELLHSGLNGLEQITEDGSPVKIFLPVNSNFSLQLILIASGVLTLVGIIGVIFIIKLIQRRRFKE